ncbi:MAG: hypothetical protein HY647_08840 [Acidobacteria bacterium]|nr:hypothetical protein [Acidobacteriota bacterium]
MRHAQADIGMLLLAGFGAMLLLILVSELESVRIMEEVRQQEAISQNRFLEGERVLPEIRTNLLLASTWTNDFLQNRTRAMEDFYRRQLWGLRQELQIARSKQDMLPLTAQQRETWDRLQAQVEEFWEMLEPVLEWTEWEKSVYATRFLRDQLIPRRAAILEITDEFQKLNQEVLENHHAEIGRLTQRFRTRMQWQMSISLLLGALVALWTIRYARRLERRLQAQYQESMAAKNNLQRLSAKVVQAQEDERRTISRELHDQIGQALTAIKVNLGRVEQKLGNAAPELGERVRESKLLAEQMVQEVRDLSRLLRPTMLDDLGLVPALEWYVRNFSRRSGIPVHLNTDRLLGRLPEEWETCIYRTVQEALTNTMRHSEATEVLIELQRADGSVVLIVEDNGQGFEFASPAAGLGLMGMSERARELGGTLSVESKQQAGTRIRIQLPLPPATAGMTTEPASSVVS